MRALRSWLPLLACAVFFGGVAVASSGPAAGTTLSMGKPGDVRADWVGSTPVWVVTLEDGAPVVLDARNPRAWYGMTELVEWCPEVGAFSAYYDGSRFDRGGYYLFGPTPNGLAQYPVVDFGDGEVRVGARFESTTRHGSRFPPQGGRWCVTDPGLGDPSQHPPAEHHTSYPAGREVLDGVVVLRGDDATFCADLTSPDPLQCAGEMLDVPVARSHHESEIVVHRGRFLARRQAGSLIDVIALPGGRVRWVQTETE